MDLEELCNTVHKATGKKVPGIKGLNLWIHLGCPREETDEVRKLFYSVMDIEYLGIMGGESYELWVHMENGDMPVFYGLIAIRKALNRLLERQI